MKKQKTKNKKQKTKQNKKPCESYICPLQEKVAAAFTKYYCGMHSTRKLVWFHHLSRFIFIFYCCHCGGFTLISPLLLLLRCEITTNFGHKMGHPIKYQIIGSSSPSHPLHFSCLPFPFLNIFSSPFLLLFLFPQSPRDNMWFFVILEMKKKPPAKIYHFWESPKRSWQRFLR